MAFKGRCAAEARVVNGIMTVSSDNGGLLSTQCGFPTAQVKSQAQTERVPNRILSANIYFKRPFQDTHITIPRPLLRRTPEMASGPTFRRMLFVSYLSYALGLQV